MLNMGAIAICLMAGFSGFPDKVEGEVVLKLQNFVTIAVVSDDKKDVVEMTFPKNKCEVKGAKSDNK